VVRKTRNPTVAMKIHNGTFGSWAIVIRPVRRSRKNQWNRRTIPARYLGPPGGSLKPSRATPITWIMATFEAGTRVLVSSSAFLETGTEVEVLTRYEPHWTAGFEIASVDPAHDLFTLRRQSDGAVLPAAFSSRQLRPRR